MILISTVENSNSPYTTKKNIHRRRGRRGRLLRILPDNERCTSRTFIGSKLGFKICLFLLEVIYFRLKSLYCR
jgi:hypothetical protein